MSDTHLFELARLNDAIRRVVRGFGWNFLVSGEWDPVQDKFGAMNAIYGTLVTSVIALGIAIPVSFGIAIFLTELCPSWLKRPLGTAVELLALSSWLEAPNFPGCDVKLPPLAKRLKRPHPAPMASPVPPPAK